jgi:hypothetical protein
MGPYFRLGRWSGGTTDGRFFDYENDGKLTFPENGGLHYGVGLPSPTTLPSTGKKTYSVVKSTTVTVGDGSLAPGTVTGALVIDFAGAATKAGMTITLDLPGSGTYVVDPAAGTGNLTVAIASGVKSPRFSFGQYPGPDAGPAGAACVGGCSISVAGFFVGPNAENVLLALNISPNNTGGPSAVSAIAALAP